MSQNKTEFKFHINADITLVETVIRNWLVANKFSPEQRSGANYFAFNDPMWKGKRGLEYYINGNEVTILAYLGTYEKPQALDGFVGAVMKQDYRNGLDPLFQELKKLESGNLVNVNAVPVAGTTSDTATVAMTATTPVQNDSLNTFMQENNKKQETMVTIGFVMAIVGLLLSFVGVTYGVILIILEYYLAIQGLKTTKRGLAIATIVIASVSILGTVLGLLFG